MEALFDTARDTLRGRMALLAAFKDEHYQATVDDVFEAARSGNYGQTGSAALDLAWTKSRLVVKELIEFVLGEVDPVKYLTLLVRIVRKITASGPASTVGERTEALNRLLSHMRLETKTIEQLRATTAAVIDEMRTIGTAALGPASA